MIGTWAEQFSGMGNFAITIWNSTFDTFFFVFHGLKTGFFFFDIKIKVCFCPQKRMSPPVPQTVVIGKKYIWVTNKIKIQ
jgi:hypothetical protein